MNFLVLPSRKKNLLIQRVDILLENALQNARNNMDLAQRQAFIARKLCMKFNFRLPYQKRLLFCKGCKKFIISGINAKIRLCKNSKTIKIICLECNHIYRKTIKNFNKKRP